MKKRFALLLTMSMLLGLLAGCGGTETPPAEEPSQEETAAIDLTIL